MVRVSIVPISKGDLRVLAPSRPLFDHGPGVGFPGRGTVSPGCRSVDDDIYLLFNWSIRLRGGVPVPTGPFLGGPEAAVGLRQELAMKLSSNSLANWSKDEMEDDFLQLYHIRAGPRSVVGKVRHISASEVS
ncbi:hypothetical protein BHE74_00030243 [Ensete ventricosum]|nr:hypothetical protein BHE74_00030243 [Ensete ventricosum]